jgi:hypothetical protein
VARLTRPPAGAELRRQLLEERKEFRALMSRTLAPLGADAALTVCDQLSGRIETLEYGEPYQSRRWELPESRPAAALGLIHDELTLGADNGLTERT